MPVYVYECASCEEQTEVVLGIYERPEADEEDGTYDLSEVDVVCENCGGTKFNKVISAHRASPNNWSRWRGSDVKAPLKKTRS